MRKCSGAARYQDVHICTFGPPGPFWLRDVLARFFNKLASESVLIRAPFDPTVEGDVGYSVGALSLLGSYGNQRALELCDAREHGEHHAPGQRRSRPGFCNGLKCSVFLLDSLCDAHTRR